MDELEDVVGLFEESCRREGFFKCPCELCHSPGICVGEAAEMWAGIFLFGSEQGSVVYVNPKGVVVAWRVGEGGVSCCGDLEAWGDVDPINIFRSSIVCGRGFLVAVVVVGADGRGKAQFTEASVEFSSNEVVVGIQAYYKAVPLVPP